MFFEKIYFIIVKSSCSQNAGEYKTDKSKRAGPNAQINNDEKQDTCFYRG